VSAFIVSAGGLLEIGCPSRLTRETAQSVDVIPLLGGRRKAFVQRGGRRAWSVDVSVARPGEVSTLEAVARQVGPYGWYGPEAVAGNLFSPQSSGFEVFSTTNAADAGLVQLPDGTVARSVLHVSYRVTVGNDLEDPPVRPGEPVTVGAWGLNGLRFIGTWRDAAGAEVGSWDSGQLPAYSGWQWREYTITAPATASAIRVQLLGGAQYALPSVAWGTVGRPELGTGCPKAIIHSPSFSPVSLWEGANYTDTSYTVTELG